MRNNVYLARFVVIGALVAVYAIGMGVDVMEVDAAQYASISREMLTTGQWLELFNRHEPYLDKPPLLFWLSAASFKVFGFNNWAYKLPSLVFALLALYATYRFVKLYYDQHLAYIAVVMLGSVQSMFTMTNDVRTDTLLMGSVALAIWLLAEYLENNKTIFLVGGSFALGLAMLSKGPIGLVAPLAGIGLQLLVKAKLRVLLRPAIYLVGLPVMALTLAPMLYGLYTQYGWAGWKFFFWTQSFGRITGDNQQWVNDPGPSLFFAHTFLWAFLPWTLFALGGLWRSATRLARGFFTDAEFISLGSFILPFVALSFSQYKLPHYILVTFPMSAVLAASWFYHLSAAEGSRFNRILSGIHLVVYGLLVALAVVLCTWAFPLHYALLGAWLLFVAFCGWFAYTRMQGLNRVVGMGWLCMLAINILLSGHVYPTLLTYQSDNAAARLYLQQAQPGEELHALAEHGHALDFYSGTIVPLAMQTETIVQLSHTRSLWLYTDDVHYAELQQRGVAIAQTYPLSEYPVTKLTIPFVNPATRAATLRKRYLLYIPKGGG
jgi:4-amino-4-deoxy-L-arabinose transferase-like glycosyltransferase